MAVINSILSWLMKKRMHQINLFMQYPYEVQQEWLRRLVDTAKDTEWGLKYGYSSIKTEADFKRLVPIVEYDDLKPYIDRHRKGEPDVLWPGEILWFAKSAGTTGDKSKYIPVSQESLDECHFKGGKDMLTLYCNSFPETHLFDGKTLSLAGTYRQDEGNVYARNGDLSAILMENLPMWAEFFRSPDRYIALMSEWEEKMDKIADAIMNEYMTCVSGVPSWMLVLLKHTLSKSGKKNIAEMWPGLEAFFHGGMNFNPYREQYKELFSPLKVNFWEVYNASEGFFGIQDSPDRNDMLLMLDYGIYYEFIPVENIAQRSPALTLSEVKTGISYALIISTTGGLWRYMIGDTIQFTSTDPFRFIITGRVRQFINAFGEELIMDNAENGIRAACERTGAVVTEYTAAPVYMKGDAKGAHEWLIEFEKEPENIAYFTEILDNALKALNSDYEAKRYKDMTLTLPVIRVLPNGTFFSWMKQRGKLGGQNKVPRLANDRKFVDDILKLVEQKA